MTDRAPGTPGAASGILGATSGILGAAPEGILGVAQEYVDAGSRRGELAWRNLAALPDTRVRVDPRFAREVAAHFDTAPRRENDACLIRRYEQFAAESLRHFALLDRAGIRVRPWRGDGQPYRGSRHLIDELERTGVLFVFLTSAGHGPGAAEADHPLCRPSGVRIDGVELVHNDVFRAVHDVFGHAMLRAGMGVDGEFLAAYGHLAMYTPEVHPVLLTEQISQICWFFRGAHLAGPDGRLPARGEPGWVPPARRPYPEQKVFTFPPGFITRFLASFSEVPR